MPYNPQIPFQPTGLAPGLGMLAGAVSDWQKKREEQDRKLASSDAIIQHARQSGQLSEEEFNKYQAGSITQKIGMAIGFAENFANDLAEKHFQAGQDYRYAQLAQQAERMNAAQRAAAAERNFRPSAEDIAAADAFGIKLVPTSPGHFTPVDRPKNQIETWETLNKDVHAATGADLGDWQNAKNKRVEGGNVVADIVKQDQWGGQVQSTIRVPKTTYDQFLGRFNALQGGPPASDIGISRQEQAAKIKRQYASKELTRDEALRQLKEIGYDD